MLICLLIIIECLEPQYTPRDLSIKTYFCLAWSNPMLTHWVEVPNGYECVFSFAPTKVCGYGFTSGSQVLLWVDFCSTHLEPTPLSSLVGRIHYSQEKSLPTQSTTQLSDPQVPPQFLSPNIYWSSVFKSIICWWTCYIGLLGPYLQHVISTFNTCSKGATTARSLTDTDGATT
jgi:hypothetical protein